MKDLVLVAFRDPIEQLIEERLFKVHLIPFLPLPSFHTTPEVRMCPEVS